METERQPWIDNLRNVNRDARRRAIFDAYELGGMTYQEIADVLGDIQAQRVGMIVREVRSEVGST